MVKSHLRWFWHVWRRIVKAQIRRLNLIEQSPKIEVSLDLIRNRTLWYQLICSQPHQMEKGQGVVASLWKNHLSSFTSYKGRIPE